MTTKLKEKIVALSRKEKMDKFFKLYTLIVLAVLLASFAFKELKVIVRIMLIIGLLWSFLHFYVLQAIRNQTDDVISNNKLLYIILSDKDTIAVIVEFIMIFPVLMILSKFIELNFITGALYVVTSVIIIKQLSKIISNRFKNKLSK